MKPLEAVRSVARELDAAGVPSSRVDAEYLVASVLGVSRTGLYAADDGLTEVELERVRALQERRQAREPLAYVLGEWDFRLLTLRVDGRALVPRPETEVLVERCLAHLADLEAPSVLDVGVGSGAVALAIADEHPGARVLGVDSSAAALALASENLARLDGDGRIRLRRGDLLRGLSGQFDLVVSNPPYVSPDEYETLQPEIRLWEPYEAIVGEGVGDRIARQARSVLRPGGPLVLECGDGQADALATELRSLGYEDLLVTADLAGRDRVVEGRRP
jgi:release factor glutamine methyltransferase